jgi:hypothetical protein
MDDRALLGNLKGYEVVGFATCQPRSKAMKTIISTLIAAPLLGLVALSANAFDPKGFYEQQDRASH